MQKGRFNKGHLFISLLALVLIVSFLFSACAKATSTTTQTSTTTTNTSTTTTTKASTTTTTTAAQKVLKIGASMNLSVAQGLQDKKWFDLFAKLYNDAGGWKIGNDTYQLQIITYDTQGNMTTAKDELNRLVLQDGCKFIIGQISTGSAAVDVTVTDPNKVIVIHEDLTNQAANSTSQYFYTTGNFFTGALSPIIAAKMANAGAKSYVSVKPDNQVGHAMDPMINAAWALGAPNVKYLGTIYVSPGTIDFGPIATKIKSLNPDVADLIYEGYNQGSVPQIYRALYDVGFKGTILPGLMSQADLTAIVVQTGKAAVEGGMQSSMGLDPRTFQTDPRMLSLCDAYVKAYGQMQTDGLTETGGFLLLEAAINATQSVDVDVIKHYLDNSPPPIQVMMGFSRLVARPDNSDYLTNVIVSSGPAGLIHDGKVMAGSLQTCKDNYLSTIIMMKLQDAYKAYWLKYGYPVWPASQKGLETFHYTDLGITGQD